MCIIEVDDGFEKHFKGLNVGCELWRSEVMIADRGVQDDCALVVLLVELLRIEALYGNWWGSRPPDLAFWQREMHTPAGGVERGEDFNCWEELFMAHHDAPIVMIPELKQQVASVLFLC